MYCCYHSLVRFQRYFETRRSKWKRFQIYGSPMRLWRLCLLLLQRSFYFEDYCFALWIESGEVGALSWLPVFLVGLTTAFVFKKTGRLAAAVVVHMVYNAVVL